MGCRCGAPLGRNSFFYSGFVVVLLAAALHAQSTSENASTIELANLEKQFRTIADRVSPSVVAISAVATLPQDSDDAIRSDSINGDKLETILEKTTRTVGTGFVIDADGYIVTNEHVVGDASQIWVTTDNRKVYPAVVIGSDPRADIAVLRIPAHNLAVASYASPESVHRGMWTIALGNPFGLAGV